MKMMSTQSRFGLSPIVEANGFAIMNSLLVMEDNVAVCDVDVGIFPAASSSLEQARSGISSPVMFRCSAREHAPKALALIDMPTFAGVSCASAVARRGLRRLDSESVLAFSNTTKHGHGSVFGRPPHTIG